MENNREFDFEVFIVMHESILDDGTKLTNILAIAPLMHKDVQAAYDFVERSHQLMRATITGIPDLESQKKCLLEFMLEALQIADKLSAEYTKTGSTDKFDAIMKEMMEEQLRERAKLMKPLS
jgi:hypothetical protein